MKVTTEIYIVFIFFSCKDHPLYADKIAEFCTKNMVPSTPHDVYANTDCIYLVVEHKDKIVFVSLLLNRIRALDLFCV